MKYGEDVFDVEHVLFSHLHNDHYNNELLWLRAVTREDIPAHKLHIYCSKDASKAISDMYRLRNEPHLLDCNRVEIHPLEFFETCNIADYKVTPLKGNHSTQYEKNSCNYLIQFPNGKTMYYALDTGLFLTETSEYLKNIKIDLIILECTFAQKTHNCSVHMNLSTAKEQLDLLYADGIINRDTKIYLTHFGQFMTHGELENYWKSKNTEYSVNIAYDGLSINEEANMF